MKRLPPPGGKKQSTSRTLLEEGIEEGLATKPRPSHFSKAAGEAMYRPAYATNLHENTEVSMKANDVMTHCVISIAPHAPIRDAIARMISHQVSGMPVIDEDGKLVGMVSESDFLRRTEMRTEAPKRRWLELLLGPASLADEYVRSQGRNVEDVMTRDILTAHRETPLNEIVRLMEEYGVKRIPILEGGRLVGIVTRADLMTALDELLMKPQRAAPADDDSIRLAVLYEMRKQAWWPTQSLDIKVRNGVVELKGTIVDEHERRALLLLVENVGGVKGTRDRLALLEPAAEAVAHAL